jgi:hypothetical protein
MKTAVEFIESIIFGEKEFSLSEIFEQAKEMEKEQIIDAYEEGCFDNILDENTDKLRAEQYYNETFNK